jgi:hypothetical protein
VEHCCHDSGTRGSQILHGGAAQALSKIPDCASDRVWRPYATTPDVAQELVLCDILIRLARQTFA